MRTLPTTPDSTAAAVARPAGAFQSVGFTPDTRTRTLTSPSPGSGTARPVSRRTPGSRVSEYTIAFMPATSSTPSPVFPAAQPDVLGCEDAPPHARPGDCRVRARRVRVGRLRVADRCARVPGARLHPYGGVPARLDPRRGEGGAGPGADRRVRRRRHRGPGRVRAGEPGPVQGRHVPQPHRARTR